MSQTKIKGDMENVEVGGAMIATSLNERRPVHLREKSIVGFLSIRDGGPTRVLFSGGGSIDICGDAQYWARRARIIEIQNSTPTQGDRG